MRILMASHHFPPRHRGGVEVHTQRVALGLRDAGEEVTVVCTDDDPLLRPGTVRRTEVQGLPVVSIGHPRVVREPLDSLGLDPVLDAFEVVARELQPDVAHFQHVMYLGLDAPRRVRALGVPVVLTLHEYWLLCARGGQFRMPDGSVCERAVTDTCGRCLSDFRFGRTPQEARVARWTERLRRVTGVDVFPLLKRLRTSGQEGGSELPRTAAPGVAAFLKERVEAVQRLQGSVDRVLSPSRFLIDRFREAGWREELFRYWPNGVPPCATPENADPKGRPGSSALRAGFMGSVTPQKGLHVLLAAHRQLERGTVEVHVHGNVRFDPAYWSAAAKGMIASEVHVHGPFEAARVSEVLAGMDVLVVPSVWYENAPLVISEAFACGIPVVTSRLGGMMEMVEHGRNGLLFAPGDSNDLARCLADLVSDRGRLAELRRGCRAPRELAQDVQDLRQLYRNLIDE